MIKKIAKNIWKIMLSSNVYFLDFEEKIIIDTGDRADHAELKLFLTKIVEPVNVQKVIFTHLHHDHIGNFDMFPVARFFAGEKEIEDFEKNPEGAVLRKDIMDKFKGTKLEKAEDMDGLKVLETPGHTRGSISLWYPKERILFSGDTMFAKGLGRTDLPTSTPGLMQGTVLKLLALNHKILCPGHD